MAGLLYERQGRDITWFDSSVNKGNGEDRILVMWRAPVRLQGARLDINLFIFKTASFFFLA